MFEAESHCGSLGRSGTVQRASVRSSATISASAARVASFQCSPA
jgi:hypothetical protein